MMHLLVTNEYIYLNEKCKNAFYIADVRRNSLDEDIRVYKQSPYSHIFSTQSQRSTEQSHKQIKNTSFKTAPNSGKEQLY